MIMRESIGVAGTGHSLMRTLLVILYFALLSGCGYHPPAPVDEQSNAMVKRQLNSDGTYYVRSGDTLYAIAFGYGLDPMNIAKWNHVSSPYVIYPGQRLQLSAPAGRNGGRDKSTDVTISTVKTPGQATTRTVSSPPKSSSTRSSSTRSTPTKSEPAPSVSKTTKTATPTNNSADPKSWKWPTKGRVLRGYVAGDPARNGLDIAGQEGQVVSASSGGLIVYSGNGLIGYGELIIIKHSENMLSAYAHNKVRLVNEGEQVSSGQKIAEMGRNTSDEQLLHFEIRSKGKPVNPLIYLPKK
jgi:lipoprotein NlpD